VRQGLLCNFAVHIFAPGFDTDGALCKPIIVTINIIESQALINIAIAFEHFHPMARILEMQQNMAHDIPHTALLPT